MSASERLRALDREATEAPWDERAVIDRLVYVKPEDGQLIATLRNALPLIADVVEAAERVADLTFHATYSGEIDGVKHYGTSGDAVRVIAPALTALQEHLEGQ